MSYQPLARKYRPGRFAELVGQEATAQALANAIATGRVLANLIFTGVRGVGKTTVARLYAKALNCRQRGEGAEPCGTCDSCLAITSGTHEDVLEIDGASNTGVADVRALQETIEYAPQRSHYKVYIIDEVHMLSTAAFNALLKTLEERRPHVIFVFATTELAKVPETILSRCPTFHLKKIPLPLIQKQLAGILTQEGVAFEDTALAVLAREGQGSLRDALTLTDQAIALGGGQVTLATLSGIVSNLSSSSYLELLEAMVRRDARAAMAVIEALDQGGAAFAKVTEETARCARHAFVLQGLGDSALEAERLGLADGEQKRLKALAAGAATFDLNRIFRTLVKARTELDGSEMDRYVLENYVFEWCFDPGLPEVETLLSAGPQTAAKPVAVAPAQTMAPPPVQAQAPAPAQTQAPTQVQTPVPVQAPSSAPRPSLKDRWAATQANPSAPPPQRPTPGAADAAMSRPDTPPAPQPKPDIPVAAPQGPSFPATWRLLADAWRRLKPLQARKLEEVHPIAYGPDRIVLALADEQFASRALLQRDEQVKLAEAFRELFAFTGELIVQTRAGATIETPAPTPAPEAPLPDTVLTQRSREAEERRQKLLDDARNAPFTREIESALGGRVDNVRLVDR